MSISQVMSDKFTKRFNPTQISEWVLPDRIKSIFSSELKNNHLFYGSQGIGKSSLAKFLAREYNSMYINAAAFGRIDYLKDDIFEFITTQQLSFDSGIKQNKKVIVLDECGRTVSEAFYEALKGYIDQYSDNIIFIITTNFFNTIPDAIKSRFVCTNFNFCDNQEQAACKSGYLKRMIGIMNELGIKYNKENLAQFAKKNFPDFRKSLEMLQIIYNSGQLSLDSDVSSLVANTFSEIYNLILKPTNDEIIFKTVSQGYAENSYDIIMSMDNIFIPYLLENHPDKIDKIGDMIISVGQHLQMYQQNVDGGITLKSLIFTLSKIFNS